MTKEQLQRFCYPGEDRPTLNHPYSVDGWTVACDGRIMVAVPRLADVPELDKRHIVAQSTRALLRANTAGGPGLRVSTLAPPPMLEEECKTCGGTGQLDGIDCLDCEGRKIVWTSPIAVQVRGAKFAHTYLHLLASLPNCTIWPSDRPLDPAMFEFDGGKGVLMPMHMAEDTNHE